MKAEDRTRKQVETEVYLTRVEHDLTTIFDNLVSSVDRGTTSEGDAIRLSVLKWETMSRVLNNLYSHIYGESCPLCAKYSNEGDADECTCHGCPVSEKTGEEECADTPWERVKDALMSAKLYAREEKEFLLSLL